MTRLIGSAVSFAVVAAGLAAMVGAAFAREISPLEGVMMWKAGLLGMVFFGFKVLEAANPSTVSVTGNSIME
ncbi:MAG: hypothetical protein ACE141_01825 [Bryobacteraceae bacterium]